jgi:hypothetical protein
VERLALHDDEGIGLRHGGSSGAGSGEPHGRVRPGRAAGSGRPVGRR